METTSKQRNQSQCREWERQRRNKFNDAINKLGEIIKAISKSSKTSVKETDKGKSAENVKYPKIEIVQKAIIYLTNSTQEKTQLKAEILALQIELESIKVTKNNRKDASTQVYLEINKKNKNGKYVKFMKKKSKHTNAKDKVLPLKPIILSKDSDNRLGKKAKEITPKLPTLLPRFNVFDKKGQENTFVVLPAAPYIFPQRSIILPSMPPAIVVVDSSLQAINKVVPIISRNGGDITKTTMVNILPISAYSRPLSASRQKKSNVRMKSETNKKSIPKKTKPTITKIQEIAESENPKSQVNEENAKESNAKVTANDKIENDEADSKVIANSSDSLISPHAVIEKEITNEDLPNNISKNEINQKTVLDTKTSEASKTIVTAQTTISDMNKNSTIEITPNISTTAVITIATDVKYSSKNKEDNRTINKLDKEVATEEKDKESKLPSILDTSLCDNVVDGGNARLELAEEFLAASPTAAFLMSFPLVSGNRADSPADEQNTASSNSKDITQKRSDLVPQQSSTSATFFEKTNHDIKMKTSKSMISTAINKQNEQSKYISNAPKATEHKTSTTSTMSCTSNENPFLNLPTPSLMSTTCALSDTTFGLDFESNIIKSATSQPTYTTNSNIFYKNDPFSTVKSTIYSTSSISSNHDFNGIGLYPCAMEKYASKTKPDFTNIDDTNVMKLGSSRLTYDIDLGWSHKGFDFVSCTANTTFGKDNTLTTVTSSTPFCTSYNPFNPEFHVPLVSTSNKRDSTNKTNSSFADTITSLYSQTTNLWPEDPFYNNSSVSKGLSSKQQNYPLPFENVHGVSNVKSNNPKQYEAKGNPETNIIDSRMKNNTIAQQINEKYTKKSPNKMHINWMTSEIRPMQSAYNPMHAEIKEPHKVTYNHFDQTTKRNDYNEANNYFPISMHNFPAQPVQEEFQVWPSTRPLGTTEISIDPPPINLPTLVGDLALGPHDKKKNAESTSRTIPQQDPLQNCSNFFSVTQLMNRSSDNATSRYQPSQVESAKTNVIKQNISHYSNDINRKAMSSRIENQAPQPYVFNNSKLTHSYENMAQFSQNKPKAANKIEKSSKAQKNNYSAEALLRGGSCSQKIQDNNSSKFLVTPQKYNDFNAPQDSSVAQVSHFPPLIDYSENSYTGQQFSGTSLYNTTTNTLSNSFYSNFMPGSSNLMPTNYTSGPFPSEFIDYNQSTECNFTTHKYEELKMRNNAPMFQADKTPSNYKSSRRESAAKHKLECSKKESSKKYQSKRVKLNSDVEEWSEPSHPLWQNKPSNKRHPNLMTEELPFPNYVSNQMHSQYQPDFFNSHLMPSNMQTVGPNVDRSLSSFPITSRANFNLSTIFPEITMKVQ